MIVSRPVTPYEPWEQDLLAALDVELGRSVTGEIKLQLADPAVSGNVLGVDLTCAAAISYREAKAGADLWVTREFWENAAVDPAKYVATRLLELAHRSH
jgi:hypothetical protein